MNHMMEIVKKIKLSGRRSDGGNAPRCVQENLAHKTAPRKRVRARSSPMRHKHCTFRFKQPVEHKLFNSSKFGSGFCYTSPPKHITNASTKRSKTRGRITTRTLRTRFYLGMEVLIRDKVVMNWKSTRKKLNLKFTDISYLYFLFLFQLFN
ncbi:unnamed protein product [Brassica oleracea var. botrytis]|uniref:BnaC09g52390D protein n=3 Tax=Brassica TaxID=3705 RepID=A0A078JEJ2_BRANA|nr:BnaC09g52390D [Brassica napus]VDD30693.1 unnamed protein product [Brassica oleracea]